jgi:Ras-related protein Rab-1A
VSCVILTFFLLSTI